MEYESFKKTTVGADYLKLLNKNGELFPIDGYLEYIVLINKLRGECPNNILWTEKFDREIEATNRILKKIIN